MSEIKVVEGTYIIIKHNGINYTSDIIDDTTTAMSESRELADIFGCHEGVI